jgi:hypothetical protein
MFAKAIKIILTSKLFYNIRTIFLVFVSIFAEKYEFIRVSSFLRIINILKNYLCVIFDMEIGF